MNRAGSARSREYSTAERPFLQFGHHKANSGNRYDRSRSRTAAFLRPTLQFA
jgi:hypothetical protein